MDEFAKQNKVQQLPGIRNVNVAVMKKVQEHVDSGYCYVVDMDLEKYFDSVNRSKLIEVLSRTIKDGRVVPNAR